MLVLFFHEVLVQSVIPTARRIKVPFDEDGLVLPVVARFPPVVQSVPLFVVVEYRHVLLETVLVDVVLLV